MNYTKSSGPASNQGKRIGGTERDLPWVKGVLIKTLTKLPVFLQPLVLSPSYSYNNIITLCCDCIDIY